MNDLTLSKCPVCDYTLDGLPDRHICPECGFEYDKKSRIFRKKQTKFERIMTRFSPVFYVAISAFWVYQIYREPLSAGSWWYPGFLLGIFLIARRIARQKCVIAPDYLALIGRRHVPEVVPWKDVDHARFNRLWGGVIIVCHTRRRPFKIRHWFFRNHDQAHKFVEEINERVGHLRAHDPGGDGASPPPEPCCG